MNTSFKVFFEVHDKLVALKGNFSKYPEYDDLRKEIIKMSEKSIFKDMFLLTEEDLFILKFGDGLKIPNLKAIWNSNTYNYFLEKLNANPLDKVKLIACRIKKYPVWNPPQFRKILEKSLEVSFKKANDELNEELTDLKLTDAKKRFDLNKKQNDESKNKYLNEIHINTICNNCFTHNFFGSRYICSECDNYNLCEYCEENMELEHLKEHTLIKVTKPILADLNKFNNIFRPQKIFQKNKEKSFSVNFEIVNNGENKLQGCFISSIRYGNNYLGCLKKTITDNFLPGEIKNIEIIITFNKKNMIKEDSFNKGSKKTLEGYFRMFTDDGLPFGDIFYVKVQN